MRAAALALLMLAGTAQAASPGWVRDYRDRSTNDILWDKRAAPLVRARVPAPLANKLLAALGGPPGPVVVVEHGVSMSACRPHSCTEKGFFWIDPDRGVGLGAYSLSGSLLLGSNGLAPGELPAAARRALLAWLDDERIAVTTVDFLDRGARRTRLAPERFQVARFLPPAGGPAFDCRRAGDAVERAVCADPDLAQEDLALAALYRDVRLGVSAMTARRELARLQAGWLQGERARCEQAEAPPVCLKAAYRAQHARLLAWTPAVPQSQAVGENR